MGVNILEEPAAFSLRVGESTLKTATAGCSEKLVPIYHLCDTCITSQKMMILILFTLEMGCTGKGADKSVVCMYFLV
jgi:hypothetical protein